MIDDVRETFAGEGPDTTPPSTEAIAPPATPESPAPEAGPPAAEAAEFRDRWLRAEAEMQNVRRRAARERDEAIASAENRFLLELVELLDDLERALGAVAPAEQAAAWVQGVALTAQRMRDTLARWNTFAIEAVGRPFDPNRHEALAEIEAPDGFEPGQVAGEVLKGWRRGERTLRAARVLVARARG